MNKTLLLATGIEQLDLSVSQLPDVNIIGRINKKEDLIGVVLTYKPETVLLTENLQGLSDKSLTYYLIELAKKSPDTRIIYITGESIENDLVANNLYLLLESGITDIIYDKILNIDIIRHILLNERTIEHEENQKIINKVNQIKEKEKEQQNKIIFQVPDDLEVEKDDGSYKNIIAISSIKPGTGKSFLVSNVATGIAAYGKHLNGKRPKVAIVEADLQNLSVGTLLGLEDSKKNLKTAVDEMNKILSSKGELIGSPDDVLAANENILRCFIKYDKLDNLYALVGSELLFEQVEEIKSYHYMYLLDLIVEHFDVIIVDTNSSLSHTTTFPILERASTCYYILNLDFNNIRNNARYRSTLQNIGIDHKVKYILNEDLDPNETLYEELEFSSEHLDDAFNLVAKIPMLPKEVFLNRSFLGIPLVLDENKKYTEKAKYELLKVSNDIYPISGMNVEKRKKATEIQESDKGMLNKLVNLISN